MVAFQIPPEQPSQVEGQAPQGRVVEHWLPFLQVSDEQVANGAALDGIAVDQLGWAELAARAESPERHRGLGPEDAHLVEQLIEAHGPVRSQRSAIDGERELEAVADSDIAQRPSLDHEDGGGTT